MVSFRRLGPVHGFMCLTDWEDEVGSASDGNKVYPSEAALRKARRCTDECGIAEVELRLTRIVQPANFPTTGE